MNDNHLKQAICNAEHPQLSAGFEQRALDRMGRATGADSNVIMGGVLGLIGRSRRTQAVLAAVILLAAAVLVQQQLISQAEEDLMGIDTLSMSTLLAL